MSAVKTFDTIKTTIDVGYSVPIEVNINKDTGLIYDVQTTFSQPFDLKQQLNRVSEFSVTLYVYFLRHYPLDQITKIVNRQVNKQQSSYAGQVTDRTTMLDCLIIYSLVGDSNFFKFLLQQLFRRWTLLSPVLYDERLPREIKWETWLHCPYQLLPEAWLQDGTFVKMWITRTDNKKIRLNGNELFEYEKKITIRDESNNDEREVNDDEREVNDDEREVNDDEREVNDKRDIKYHNSKTGENIEIEDSATRQGDKLRYHEIYSYFNGKSHGHQIRDLHDRNRVEHSNYIKHQSNGPNGYVENGILDQDSYLVDGKIHGQSRVYYPDGQLDRLTTWVAGVRDGPHLKWYNDAHHTLKAKVGWQNGQLTAASFYRLDGNYITAHIRPQDFLRSSVVALVFYDQQHKVTRQITHPIDLIKTKVDIHFDLHGNVIQSSTEDKSIVYDLNHDTWILHTSQDELDPYYY